MMASSVTVDVPVIAACDSIFNTLGSKIKNVVAVSTIVRNMLKILLIVFFKINSSLESIRELENILNTPDLILMNDSQLTRH